MLCDFCEIDYKYEFLKKIDVNQMICNDCEEKNKKKEMSS